VEKFMPAAPAAWDKITIFHLLTHTSGIPSFTSFLFFEAHRSATIRAVHPASITVAAYRIPERAGSPERLH
jgi:CubicO group peptidase (beta-lactamase class C family)